MAGPSCLIVNLRFNPPEIEIVGPVLESTVLKLGSLLPRMTSLSRNRARKELPQFQREQLVGISLSSNNTTSNQTSNSASQLNNNSSNSNAISKSLQQQQQNSSSSNNNNNSSSAPVVWRLELPCSVAHEVAQMQMCHAIFECIDEEGVWDMRDSMSFTGSDDGVDYTCLIFVKKPKRKEL